MALRKLKTTVTALAAALALTAGAGNAEPLKIGFLSDLSGGSSVLTGESSRVAIQMAIDDFGGEVNGEKIELLVADQLNKADVGLSIAREWFDVNNIDMLFSVDNSAVALAVSPLAAEKGKLFIHGASSTAMTNDSCHPLQIQMLMDTYGLSRAITTPLVQAGMKDWFFITVDYAFGKDLQAKGEAAIKAAGGNVVGSVLHSPTEKDYSAFLLEAKAKGAQTIGLATFGSFQTAIVKQAAEFGIDIPMVPYFLGITDIKAAGLENLQGVQGAIQFYWDQNDKTRAFAKRYQEHYNRPPTFTNAMHYEMITHYLKAVKAAGSADPVAVNAKMREMPVELISGDTATIRADGRVARPMYGYSTKKPSDSSGDWDYLTIGATVPADTLLLPAAESTCSLMK